MNRKVAYCIIGFVALVGIFGLFNSSKQNQPSTLGTSVTAPSPLVQASMTPSPSPSPSPQTVSQSQNSELSNDNYYINSDGNSVHSPAYSNTVPQGATAQCNDGTYSFSQHRQGTCSHHGGVAQWY